MTGFKSPFSIGQIVTNNEITKAFKVGNMGGMRRSKATESLVIISDHTKGLYDDKWYGDELHYTGMGKNGDQTLTGNQNKTLAESDTNGVEVHLFEVFNPSEYIYRGVVHLCDKPYQDDQKDASGNLRKVWIFPLRTEAHTTVSKVSFDSYSKRQERKAKELSLPELEKKAREQSTRKVAHRSVVSNAYDRNKYVARYAKERADGICQLCEQEAPFNDKEGKPYLECHHIKWLSEGGDDSLENTVALCPNCHRKMHVVNDSADREFLRKKAAS